MKNIKEFKPIYNLIKEYKFKLIIATFLIFICGISEILTGYLNGAAIEAITSSSLKMAVIYLLIYFFIESIFSDYLHTVASSMLNKIENIASRKLSYLAYKKALDLPSYAYEQTTSGEVINRITNDADALNSSFERLIQIFTSLIGSFILIIYIFFNSWIVGLEIIFFIAILFLIIKIYNPILKKIHKERKKEQDSFTTLTNESIRGIREVKTLGIKKNLLTDISIIIKTIFKKSIKEIDMSKKFDIVTGILKSFLEVGVFITCAILLYNGKVSITFFISMTYYVYRYMWLIENINSFAQTYQDLIVSLGRINEILENRLYEDEQFGNVDLDDIEGIIEFKDVTFGYPNEDIILNKFNLKIEPNKKIAIIGASGQGKSTLFNLLTRVFDTNEGTICIDDVNIKDLTEYSLRKNISIIRQEPFIFNRTIKQNFELINENITLEEIRRYTNLAYLDEYIMSLPNKYDTLLGENGVNLSGGQKQRLAIARTLAKESKIILFDEATSALDNNSQQFIKKAIDNLVKEHTIVIVAHRLSTIMDADIIYVVEKGKIVASGNHDELLKTSKIYKTLYEKESQNI